MRRALLVAFGVSLLAGQLFARDLDYLNEYDCKSEELSCEINFFLGASISNLARKPIGLNDYYKRKEGKKPDLCVSLQLLTSAGSYVLPYVAVGLEGGVILHMDRQSFSSATDCLSLGGLWYYITPEWLERNKVCKHMETRLNYTEVGLPLSIYIKLAPFYQRGSWFSFTGLAGVNFLTALTESSYYQECKYGGPFLTNNSEVSFSPFFTVGARIHLGIVGISYTYNFAMVGMGKTESYYKARAHCINVGFLYTLAG